MATPARISPMMPGSRKRRSKIGLNKMIKSKMENTNTGLLKGNEKSKEDKNIGMLLDSIISKITNGCDFVKRKALQMLDKI